MDSITTLPRSRAGRPTREQAEARHNELLEAALDHFLDKGFEVGNYHLVEANVTAQLSKEYLAVLRVDDALDVRPETRMGYHSAGRVISVVLQGTWQ